MIIIKKYLIQPWWLRGFPTFCWWLQMLLTESNFGQDWNKSLINPTKKCKSLLWDLKLYLCRYFWNRFRKTLIDDKSLKWWAGVKTSLPPSLWVMQVAQSKSRLNDNRLNSITVNFVKTQHGIYVDGVKWTSLFYLSNTIHGVLCMRKASHVKGLIPMWEKHTVGIDSISITNFPVTYLVPKLLACRQTS